MAICTCLIFIYSVKLGGAKGTWFFACLSIVLLGVVAVFRSMRLLRWQWSHPLLKLDSEYFHWRMDKLRAYETVDLADVVGCRLEYGLDLRLDMRSGPERAFDLNRVP